MSIETNEYAVKKLLNGSLQYLEEEAARIYAVEGAIKNDIGMNFLVSEYEEEIFVTLLHRKSDKPIFLHCFKDINNVALDFKNFLFSFYNKLNKKITCHADQIYSINLSDFFCFDAVHQIQSIHFNKFDLIELFSVLPNGDSTKETYQFKSEKNKFGFTLEFSFSVNENWIKVNLNYDIYSDSIYELIIKNVSRIEVEKKQIKIFHCNDQEIRIDYNEIFSLKIMV